MDLSSLGCHTSIRVFGTAPGSLKMSSKGKPGHDQRTPKRRHKWWCVVCGSDEDDELKYGPFSKTKEFNVHFFCLVSEH